MSNDDQNVLSVEELEEKIRAKPDDADLKEDLAGALLDRYLSGDEGKDPGNEADINRVREIVGELPESTAYYPTCLSCLFRRKRW